MGAKAKHDVAPVIRGAFLRALELTEAESGKTFSELVADAIRSEGLLPVLDRISKFTVREAKNDLTSGGKEISDLVYTVKVVDASNRNPEET